MAIIILFRKDVQPAFRIAPTEWICKELERRLFGQPGDGTGIGPIGKHGCDRTGDQPASPDVLSPGHDARYRIPPSQCKYSRISRADTAVAVRLAGHPSKSSHARHLRRLFRRHRIDSHILIAFLAIQAEGATVHEMESEIIESESFAIDRLVPEGLRTGAGGAVPIGPRRLKMGMTDITAWAESRAARLLTIPQCRARPQSVVRIAHQMMRTISGQQLQEKRRWKPGRSQGMPSAWRPTAILR
ncbi:hypothetical protein PX699_03720 [Sphingobium sp. H39-3-25]|uniref:hypothetical protein n=1 Tax=Sphingobium arseniciresistens TaxID=3030834 RepID=UPI0023B9841D|nr:hypothetical protein [Sphingobium arseniciresistens]